MAGRAGGTNCWGHQSRRGSSRAGRGCRAGRRAGIGGRVVARSARGGGPDGVAVAAAVGSARAHQWPRSGWCKTSDNGRAGGPRRPRRSSGGRGARECMSLKSRRSCCYGGRGSGGDDVGGPGAGRRTRKGRGLPVLWFLWESRYNQKFEKIW